MLIRLLTSQDAPQYRELRLKALQTDPQVYQSTYELEKDQTILNFSRTLEFALQPPIFGYYGFFVEDETSATKEKLVGYIHLEYQPSPKKQHIADLLNLFVDPDFRGQGIGSQLFDHVSKIAKDHGIEQLTLQCSASNVNAINLYHQQGFQEFGREKNGIKWQGTYDDIVMLQKSLV